MIGNVSTFQQRKFKQGRGGHFDSIGYKNQLTNNTELIAGRMITAQICIGDKVIKLINIYGPNNDDENFFNILDTYTKDNNNKSFITGENVTQYQT